MRSGNRAGPQPSESRRTETMEDACRRHTISSTRPPVCLAFASRRNPTRQTSRQLRQPSSRAQCPLRAGDLPPDHQNRTTPRENGSSAAVVADVRSAVECFCCGEERDPAMVAPLLCHEAIKLCRMCVGWLMQRAGGVDVAPTLPVSDMEAAIRFYGAAGLDVERYDDGFAFVRYVDQSVFDLDLNEHARPPANAAGCYIITQEIDAWHGRFAAARLDVTSVEDEFTLTDPSGNHVRVGTSVAELASRP
jgi:catechol 2,3-dioxygenase-like lactoylglutathione lyase family enzyme